jgi:Fe2+ transport system protein B
VIWVACIVGVLLFTGWLASKVVPGKRVPLITELPPMRMPVLGNVLKKTGGRLKWYLIEVIPLFLIGTLIMFGLDRSGALPWIIEAGKPLVVGWLGLPPEASAAFVMGFLRRDFGASGLFALQSRAVDGAGGGRHGHDHAVRALHRQPDDDRQGAGHEGRRADAGDDHPHRLLHRRRAQPRPAADLLRDSAS